MAKQRYRLQQRFWLDMNRTDDERVADTIELLKNERAYTQAVKDGLMIVSELRQGRADLLCELYPWLIDEFDARRSDSGSGGDDVKASIQHLEQLIMAQGREPIEPPSQGPKALSVPQIAGPIYDDDDSEDLLTVTKTKASGGNASENFLKSAFAVAGIR